jgi:hypothetical protein
MKKLKNAILVVLMVVILTSLLFILTGCKISAETSDNGVSVEVDEDTKGTFESILSWIDERISRIFDSSSSN